MSRECQSIRGGCGVDVKISLPFPFFGSIRPTALDPFSAHKQRTTTLSASCYACHVLITERLRPSPLNASQADSAGLPRCSSLNSAL